MPTPHQILFESSPARTDSVRGSRTVVARSGSAGTAGRRCSVAIPTTPIRSAFASGRSTEIQGSARASASSWPTPRRGSRSQRIGCPAAPRVAAPGSKPPLSLRTGGQSSAIRGLSRSSLGIARPPRPIRTSRSDALGVRWSIPSERLAPSAPRTFGNVSSVIARHHDDGGQRGRGARSIRSFVHPAVEPVRASPR